MTDEDTPNQPKPAARRPRTKGVDTNKSRHFKGQAKAALAVIDAHLQGLYQQMEWLKNAIDQLRSSL